MAAFFVFVVVVVYAAEKMDSGVAAMIGGAGLGLMLAAVGALIYAVTREERDRRDRRAAEEAWRRSAARETWTEAVWREWTGGNGFREWMGTDGTDRTERTDRQVEAPSRALVKR